MFKAIDNNKMTEAKNEDEIPCKVILVGDSGVGKTSIIGIYLNRYSAEQRSTIGASYSNKLEEIDNYKINFDIWDTAGQERFRSVNTIFYKEAYICIMVYDITKEESFQSIKEYWYNTVTENSLNKIIFGIAGNKIDLFAESEVEKKEVEKYATKINALFSETSAKQDPKGFKIFIKELLGKLLLNQKIIDNTQGFMDKSFHLGKAPIKKKKEKVKKCCE